MVGVAMVLAAGLGTRLRPLTERLPKALVPIGDRPSLAHVLGRLRAAGVDRVAVNAHHRAAEVVAFARAWPGVVVSREEADLLGTAGGVAFARPLLGEGDLLVYNADTFAEVDVIGLSRAHAAGGAAATLLVRTLPAGQGSLGLDDEGRVVRMRDARVGVEARGAHFLGVHVLGAALRGALPRSGCLVGDVYMPALRRGVVLRTLAHDGAAFDVGTFREYVLANFAWLAARGLRSFVGPRAIVSGEATVEDTIVGEGATITGSGRIDRCVVWPGAAAVAPLSDAVVTTEGVVAGVSTSPPRC